MTVAAVEKDFDTATLRLSAEYSASPVRVRRLFADEDGNEITDMPVARITVSARSPTRELPPSEVFDRRVPS